LTHEQDLGALARSIIDSNHYMTVRHGPTRADRRGCHPCRTPRRSIAGGWNALHVSADAIVLTNVGNIIHSGYVFHPSAGPVWALHTFYLVTMALMLT
jgi:hypothetical protein